MQEGEFGNICFLHSRAGVRTTRDGAKERTRRAGGGRGTTEGRRGIQIYQELPLASFGGLVGEVRVCEKLCMGRDNVEGIPSKRNRAAVNWKREIGVFG